MANEINTQQQMPLFRLIIKNALFIFLVTVLCALLALGYCALKVKPTYTVSKSVILRTNMDGNDSASQTEASLAKLYLPVVSSLVRSPSIIEKANSNYSKEGGRIYSGGVGMSYNERSLIFSLSYTDVSQVAAEEKLDAVIKAAKSELYLYIEADNVTLTDTQSSFDVVLNNSYMKYTIIGAFGGLAISLVIVLILYVLDNTVKDKQEFEEMTGIDVIAYIDKDKKGKRKKNNKV